MIQGLKIKSLLLILILGVALFLRLYLINQSVWFQSGYDESRDMLVASHILQGEFINRGPLAAGGLNWLKNSAFYYYFVASLWFFTRNPVFFMYFWAILMTTPVLIAYLIGKKINGTRTGLILAGLFAVNFQMVYSSRELLQPHLLLIFSLGFIFAGVSYLKNTHHSLKYLLWMIFFILIPLHFHYGVLILLPTGLSFIFFLWIKMNTQKVELIPHYFFGPLLLFLVMVSTWVLSTYRLVPFDQAYFFLFNFEKHYDISSITQLQKTAFLITQMVWGNYFSDTRSLILFSLFLLFPLSLKMRKFLHWKIEKTKNFQKILSFLFIMSCSFVFFAFYKHDVAETYLLFVFPFFLILLGLSFDLMIQRSRWGWLILFLSLFILVSNTVQNIFKNLPKTSFHNQQKEIAQTIYEDYKFSYKENTVTPENAFLLTWYTTIRNMPFDGWGTSGVWFYLEKYFGQSLVINTSFGVNHTPKYAHVKTIYMVCDHRSHPELIEKECIDRFLQSYPIVENTLKQLPSQKDLSLWSISVNPEYKRPLINIVHQEFLEENSQ